MVTFDFSVTLSPKFGNPSRDVLPHCVAALCATEGGQCSCPGGKVKFGFGTMWSDYKSVSAGSIACTNTEFGGDPVRNPLII